MKSIFLKTVSIIGIAGAFWSCSISSPSTSSEVFRPTQTNVQSEIVNTNTPVWATTPSPFPVSTLLPADAQEKVLSLLENNGDCSLPCFWGITPGSSTWESTLNFLSPFAENIYEANRISSPDFTGFAEFFFSVPEDVSSRGKINLRLWTEDGNISRIQVLDLYSSSYDLGKLMDEYGQPDDIRITTYRSYIPLDAPPFAFSVYYSNKGFIINYTVSAIWEGDLIKGCLKKGISVYLWQPKSDFPLTFEQAALPFDEYIKDVPLLALEEATGMTVSSFYETQKGNNSQICITTPRNLWPDG